MSSILFIGLPLALLILAYAVAWRRAKLRVDISDDAVTLSTRVIAVLARRRWRADWIAALILTMTTLGCVNGRERAPDDLQGRYLRSEALRALAIGEEDRALLIAVEAERRDMDAATPWSACCSRYARGSGCCTGCAINPRWANSPVTVVCWSAAIVGGD